MHSKVTNSISPAYVIAEIGVNHESSIELALEMVKTAALAGANAVKFQTYASNTLAAEDSPSYWDLSEEPTDSQRKLFSKLEQPSINFYIPIIEKCKDLGIDFLTSCFDEDLLKTFEPYMSKIKISSSDITNYPLLKAAASYNKHIILSTGASTQEEIKDAIKFIRANQCQDVQLTLLHCVLLYPCPSDSANLSCISSLNYLAQQYTNVNIGYSCHVPMPEGIESLITAFTWCSYS